MRLDPKKIGKIQLALGVLIFIAVIITSVICIKVYFLNPWVLGVIQMSSTWGEVSTHENATSLTVQNVKGEVVSDIIIFAYLMKASLVIFIAVMSALLFISIMLILQGLVNINYKK